MSVLDRKMLTKIEDFYIKMTDIHIVVNDYKHAYKVWKSFKCETLGEYFDLYSKSNIFMLNIF